MPESRSVGTLVNARIVFWGIEGCGKTSNLRAIYAKLRPDHRGEMRNVPTPLDPSASFEELPIELGEIAGVRTQIQLVTVPGGPTQAPTRKRILDEVDGIVLVIDSQRDRIDENLACVNELRDLLADYGRTVGDVPLVVQYNKRDLADAYFMDEIHRRLDLGDVTVFEAVATEQTGVLQTLSTISKRVIRSLRDHDAIARRAPAPASAPAEPPTEIDRSVPETAMSEDLAPADPRSARERMEAAILDEPDHSEAEAIDAVARQAESMLEPTWERLTAEFEKAPAVRIGADLSVVSVGEATRAGDRGVRVPIVLGDGEGNTSTLMLTIQLDPVIEET